MLVTWQEQSAGCAGGERCTSDRLARGGGTSRPASGRERGRRENGQQMQPLGKVEKGGSIWSKKLRMKLDSRGLEDTLCVWCK